MTSMLYLLLVLSLILCCVAAAQNAAPSQTNVAAAVSVPTPPPLPPSPVDIFRKVLAMSEPERASFLATLKPEKREIVKLKLDEYQGMPAEQREQRLRALQVRIWVRQLIKLPQSNRVERLAVLRPTERQLVEERLANWDRLPPDLQKEVFTNELAIRHIAALPFNPALPPLPPEPRMASRLNHWHSLPEARRAEILAHFESFFEEFTAEERAKIMAQRHGLAKSVTPIADLTKEQRERYIEGFKRFTALTPAERDRFLRKAEHWQKMTPEQRASWRVLARKLTSAATPPPPPIPGRPSAAILPVADDHAAADLPSR